MRGRNGSRSGSLASGPDEGFGESQAPCGLGLGNALQLPKGAGPRFSA